MAVVLIGIAWAVGLRERSQVPRPAPRPAPAREGQPAPVKPSPARLAEPVPDYTPLRRQLESYIDTRQGHYTVYFKDLRSGAAFGIDEDRPVAAASTVKVPLVLYLYQLIAEGRESFDTRLTYRRDRHYQTGAGILHMVASDGETYSIGVLSNLIITISDNVAWRMLEDHLGKGNIAAFMRNLGGRTVYPGGENVSTARDMAVYVQAVLDFAQRHPDLGGRLLDHMAHSIYHVGLPGELPPSLRVAHKEGDLAGVSDDIGVVYAKRPFIFAVLSDNQPDPLAGFREIAHLTRIVHDYQQSLAGSR